MRKTDGTSMFDVECSVFDVRFVQRVTQGFRDKSGSGFAMLKSARSGEVRYRICLTVLLFVLLLAATPGRTAERPADFGRQWVRSHRFAVTALVQRPCAVADDNYAALGLSHMLIWKEREPLFQAAQRMDLPWHLHINKRRGERLKTDEYQEQVRNWFRAYAGGEAILVWDEPIRPDMAKAAEAIAWCKREFPDKLVYSNAYPGGPHGTSLHKHYGGRWISSGVYADPGVRYIFDDYLTDFVRILGPDILCFDTYPFVKPPEGTTAEFLHTRYFSDLAAVRRVALREGLPYWLFVQSFSHQGGGGRRYPSESDFRMQIYAALTFGFTGIQYFTYEAAFETGLLDGECDTPGRLYHDAQEINRELAHLGGPLRFLTSTGVWYIPGRNTVNGPELGNLVPLGLEAFAPADDHPEVLDVQVDSHGVDHNGLIGFFTDDQGGRYLMLTNLRQGPGLNAADAESTFSLRFASEVRRLLRLSRVTGDAEPVEPENGQLRLTLPGGTADLFMFGDGVFPGMDQ